MPAAPTPPHGRRGPGIASLFGIELRNVVVISPHFDDAILSCGGLIRMLTRQRVNVTVLTIFSGHPVPPLSDAATFFHDKCGLGPDAISVREAEDDAACARLCARTARLGLPDCLYRTDQEGSPRYPRIPDIWHMDPDAEKDVIDDTRRGLETSPEWNAADLVLRPLGVGGHADHQIARVAADSASESATELAHWSLWYEDQPYVFRERCAGWEKEIAGTLVPNLVTLDSAAWVDKIDAISYYRSQLLALWTDGSSWRDQVRGYASMVGHPRLAERYWARS